ncbi:uncharacterized protein ARMOST_17327 [Armillaria ostoyae]|uniref:Uncharacterized protein n=1 Tax=Armillaria ostoyae TaxID=47428 RepID=A0A284RYM9_ARMOS|nr:uncharacterized protein ARMOST_17327 [Armillaria ostoyae]
MPIWDPKSVDAVNPRLIANNSLPSKRVKKQKV